MYLEGKRKLENVEEAIKYSMKNSIYSSDTVHTIVKCLTRKLNININKGVYAIVVWWMTLILTYDTDTDK